ncbi:hypothetical protein [Mesorhizobium sp. f-mel]
MASPDFQKPGIKGPHWQRQADGTFLFCLDRSSKTRVVNADQLNSLIEIQNREWAIVLLTLIPLLMFIALWLAGRMASIWVLLAAAVWIAFNHYIHRRLRAQAGAILSTTPLSHDELVFPNVSIDLIAAGLARSVPPYLRNSCLIMSILFAGSSAVTLVDGMAHLTLGAQEMNPIVSACGLAIFGLLSHLFCRARKLRL